MNSNNKDYLSTKGASDILSVSTSTIRRWANNNILPCFRVGVSKYRKFKLSDVMKLKNEYYGEKDFVSTNTETKSNINIITESISAKSHPAHYLMHKYWGRKPHNVVSEYIKCFSNEGDTILEPFMGSGVTVIEAIKLNRKVIGIDINPMSKFIVDNTISHVDLNLFTKIYNKISNDVSSKYSYLYETICPICGEKATLITGIWENDILVKIKGYCSEHGNFIKNADNFDLKKYDECSKLKQQLLEQNLISYPTDKIMKYVKRSGRERINELFSDRALIILSELRNSMLSITNKTLQNLLLFCFTSMLSNVSRMLPGDLEKATYKSGWVISKFWTPKIHTERNIFTCLDLRFKAIIKGKKELTNINDSLAKTITGDSSHLSTLSSNSIDYIFTDPPYGESIAYLALSHFWNSWLDDNVDYNSEIIIDPYRQKNYSDYSERAKSAYRELYRVLKPNHYMSFTFNNRDLNVWKAILDACYEAGFILENIILQEQAVTSGTQGINKKNTLTGDFIYNFKKPLVPVNFNHKKCENSHEFIKNKISEYIEQHDGATPSKLYEYLIPIIVQNQAYSDDNGCVINIETILKNTYDYIEITTNKKNKIGGAYKWVKKSK